MATRKFDFELVITGMCFLEFDKEFGPESCTIRIPKAAPVPATFENQLGKGSEKIPVRHLQILSYPTRFQIAYGSSPRRKPDRVAPASDGDELGICQLKSEKFTLQIVGDSQPSLTLQGPPKPTDRVPCSGGEGCFHWASNIHDLIEEGKFTFEGLNPARIGTEIVINSGEFATLECGRQRGELIPYQFAPVKSNPTESGRRSLADAIVLRVSGVTKRVILHSETEEIGFAFSASHWESISEPVRICISNFHESLHDSPRGLFDFLWYYYALKNLKRASDKRKPDWDELLVPWIPQDLSGKVTGASGHCPPTLIFIDRKSSPTEEPIMIKIDGKPTNPILPYCVMIVRNNEIVGSGVLVTKNIVLTAGHVMEENPTGVVVVSVDKSKKYFPFRSMDNKSRARPGNYSEDELTDDLLLYRLKSDASEFQHFAPTGRIDTATDLRVVGFGFAKNFADGEQREAKLDVLSSSCSMSGNEQIYECHRGKEIVTDEAGDAGAYFNDSGAPALIKVDGVWVVAAIASRVVRGVAGVYVRVDAYSEWLTQNMAKLSA